MRLAGVQKLTLLDYPGKVACTVFTQGCNLRCPFCQNPGLVLPQLYRTSGDSSAQAGSLEDGNSPGQGNSLQSGLLPEEEFFAFLEKRKGKLSAVAITGGEPTLQAGLHDFIRRIREMGYLVKLDTNGLKPQTLRGLLEERLVDYVAMDVKNTPAKYALTCGYTKDAENGKGEESLLGAEALWERASQSISILMGHKTSYEFRTTVVKGLHTVEDIEEMAKDLTGARAWYLQQFVENESLVGSFTRKASNLSAPSKEELEEMKGAASRYVPAVSVRGV